MPIIGFTIDKINAEKKKNPSGKLNITNTPKIAKLELIPVDGLGNTFKECIKIEWEFDINYEPKVGNIHFAGNIMYLDPKQEEIMKKWKKDKSIPEHIMLESLNHLFRRIISKALPLIDEMGLPPSIPFPAAHANTQEQKSPKYIE